mmetsp:Transcript_6827/g.13574  ORF Transcript_6827/g.13574 Transcript_6827/m.13574 type:complete len:835 (+) Transcript_6827:117-2621(+)
MSTTRTNTMGDEDICGTPTIEDVIELTANTRRRIRSLARTNRFGKELLCLGRFLGKVESLVGSLEESIAIGGGGERLKCQSPGGGELGCCGVEQTQCVCVSSSSLLHSTSSLNQQHALFASMYSGDLEYPCADLEDIVDAVEGVKEAASATERQASVERFLLLEQNQEMLKVVASDLGYSITTFEPLLPLLPEDVNEDYWILQKQLTELSFFADPDAVTIANDAVNGVLLHYYGCMSDAAVSDVLTRMLLRLIDEDVHAALGDAPLHGRCMEWTMENVSSLYKTAMVQKIAGDYSVYFQYLLLAQGIAVMLCNAVPPGDVVLGRLDVCFPGWTRDRQKSDHVVAWERVFREEDSLDAIDERVLHEFVFTVKQIHSELESVESHVHCLRDIVMRHVSDESCPEWDAESLAGLVGHRLIGEDMQDAFHPVISLSVALLVEQQAMRKASLFAEAGIPEKMLSMLEYSTTPASRAAILMACRSLFRDSSCRESVHDRHGGLLILLRFLTSPVALVRRNAAKALGNYCINNEELKLLAHNMGGTASLFSMMKRGDVLGQEAATATVANLAANSIKLQQEIGNLGNPFTILVNMVESHVEKPRKGSKMVLKNAARALQNLTGRVNVNRLKAVDVGAIPLMEKLLRLEGTEPRSSAAVALCNMTRCTLSDGFEISSQGIISLLDVISEPRTTDIAKSGSLLAVKHAVSRMANAGNVAQLSSVEIREDHVDALIKFLQDNKVDIRCTASKVIGILCESRTERITKSFVRRGVLDPLVQMLQRHETASSAELTLDIISSNDNEAQSVLRSLSARAHAVEKDVARGAGSFNLTRSDSSPIEAVS